MQIEDRSDPKAVLYEHSKKYFLTWIFDTLICPLRETQLRVRQSKKCHRRGQDSKREKGYSP